VNIILVEDNENTAILTKLYLEKSGIADHVDHTFRIKPFEHLVNANKYELAIIDYHLQVLDAPEFVKTIKNSKLNSGTPVIVVSHELNEWEKEEIKILGVQYIRRHDDYMVFMELIRQTLRKMN